MSTRAVNLKALDELIRPAVEGQGYELVELKWGRSAGSSVLQVTIDHLPIPGSLPGDGLEPRRISHSDCVRVSREVSALLDVKDVLPGHYNLEVSSPGLDRPLKRSEDFARFIGQRAKVRLVPGAHKSITEATSAPAGAAPADASKSTPSRAPASAAPRRNFVGVIVAVHGDVVHLDAEGGGLVQLHVAEMEKANLIYQF